MEFLSIPSWDTGYRNSKGEIIPKLIKDKKSTELLYFFNSDDMSPIKTIYLKTIEEEVPAIELSIKGGIRQLYQDNFFFIEPKFEIVCDTTEREYISLLKDICKFPMNPSANPFLASDLVIERNGKKIRNYLNENGIFNITEFEYYPDYYLFFLLTRFYSYPYSEVQIQLAKQRYNANSFQKRFIDSIFEREDAITYSNILFEEQGEEKLQNLFQTDYDFANWANEYIDYKNEKRELNPNEYQTVLSLSEILYSWTDRDIDQYANEINFELPTRETHNNRYSWIETMAGFIIATGIYGYIEEPLFPDNNLSDIERPWHNYSNYDLLLL